ncbi:MAG: alpha/beta hydrolase [Novosphingobium sp.]
MRPIAQLALALVAALASPAAAQVVTYEVVEEEARPSDHGADRLVDVAAAVVPHGIARFGPFRVLDAKRAALVDVTDARSPAAFAAMLAAYPAIAELDMIECPGTMDDVANLRLGRMIHARALITHVPNGGSVRSGAVELFLAGTRRSADSRAEFAVHSWIDDDGKQPSDFARDAPVNRTYLDYYREMGMSPIEAQAFYDMTTAAANDHARWMNAAQMSQWVRLDKDS